MSRLLRAGRVGTCRCKPYRARRRRRLRAIGRNPESFSAPRAVPAAGARDDQFVSFDDGRMISQLIPNATFVPLDSPNHLLLENEPAWPLFLDEIRRFIGSSPGAGESVPTTTTQPSDNAPPLPDDLTPREMDILLLLARGKTNREIAEELVITANTVANHVKSILSKTNNANDLFDFKLNYGGFTGGVTLRF